MTALELWLRVHDATLAAGHDEEEAVRRADHHYWPAGEKCSDHEAWEKCTPFFAISSRLVP